MFLHHDLYPSVVVIACSDLTWLKSFIFYILFCARGGGANNCPDVLLLFLYLRNGNYFNTDLIL
jgi:hypothetical protein